MHDNKWIREQYLNSRWSILFFFQTSCVYGDHGGDWKKQHNVFTLMCSFKGLNLFIYNLYKHIQPGKYVEHKKY